MSFLLKTTNILTFILVLISITLLANFINFEYNLLNYPYQWEVNESMSLNHAIILSEGKPLYDVTEEPPLIIEPYGPVYSFLVAPLLNIFGKGLFAPRLVSLISFLLIQLFVSYAVFSLTHNWKFIFLSIGLNIFMLDWWQYLLVSRPDALGNLFLFLTIFIHWKFPDNKTAVFLSLLTGLLAFFTKVYFACGFASIVLSYWFVHKNKKMALLYLIYSSVLLISAVLIINYATNGLYYIFTVELMSSWTTYSLPFLLSMLKPFIFWYFPIFILFFYTLLKGSFNLKRYGVFFMHLLIGMPLFSCFLLNDGGGTYYWYSIIPVLIVIGCDLIYMESRILNNKVHIPILLLIVFLMIFRVGYKDIVKNRFVIPSPELASKWEPLEELIRNTKGRIMNNDITAIINIRTGKELFIEALSFSSYLLNQDFLRNNYGYYFLDINKEIASKKYALIISPPKEIKAEVDTYYELYRTYNMVGHFGRWKHKIEVFAPKSEFSQAHENIIRKNDTE